MANLTRKYGNLSRLRHEGAMTRTDRLDRAVIKAVDQYGVRLRAMLSNDRGRKANYVAIRRMLDTLVSYLEDIVGSHLEAMHDWGYETSRRNLASSLSVDMVKQLMRKRLRVEEQTVACYPFQEVSFHGLEIGRDLLDRILAPARLAKAQAYSAVLDFIAPPLPKKTVQRLLRRSYWGDGLTWSERIQGFGRYFNFKRIARELADGISSGEAIPKIRKRLDPLVDGIKWKARRIARTEALRVANQANREAEKNLGEIGRQVLAIIDQATRDHHLLRHGRIYHRMADGDFRSDGGELLPYLPDEPNCRCWDVPIIDRVEDAFDVSGEQQAEITRREEEQAKKAAKKAASQKEAVDVNWDDATVYDALYRWLYGDKRKQSETWD